MDTKRILNISKALADETRLGILAAITAQDNLSSRDLAGFGGVAPATISHHLRILRQAKLIECRKEGQFVRSRTITATFAEYTESLAILSKTTCLARKARKK